MRLHIISCQVLGRELNYYSALSDNIVEITWLPQGLHDTPNLLREEVIKTIDKIMQQKEDKLLKYIPDYIVLGYGLCSNGVIGIKSNDIPIVIPKTDDCIALFLGSQKRYLELFYKYSGTYWYNNGWIETAILPTPENHQKQYDLYAELYGEDNAEYLMEQDGLWVKNYKYCGYITSTVYQNQKYLDFSKEIAKYRGWEVVQIEGNSSMIKDMIDGNWNDTDFLIMPPFHIVEAAYDGSKITCKPCN